jgi:hypothetical protein
MYDFAEDDTLRRAAGMVPGLPFGQIRGWQQPGRRVVPFRRLTEHVSRTYLYEMSRRADHQNGPLRPSGRTDRLMDNESRSPGEPRPGDDLRRRERLPGSDGHSSIWRSTNRRIVHRIHHAGIEIYASSTGYLLSAGGIETASPTSRVERFPNDRGRGRTDGADPDRRRVGPQ